MAKTDEFLTVKEAAEYLGVAPNALRNWAASGKIPEHRHPINNYRLFKLKDLAELKGRIARPRIQHHARKASNSRIARG